MIFFLATLMLLSGPAESAPPERATEPSASPAPERVLHLDEVLLSLDDHFPRILAAREQRALADGQLISAQGGFDTDIFLDGLAEPLGFYQNEQLSTGVRQTLPSTGIDLKGYYRLGQGDFPVWDKDLQTNSDGEFGVGVDIPLLRDRAIDKRRLSLWQARLQRRRVDPQIEKLVLQTRGDAAVAYWHWVAAGEKRQIAVQLLELAMDRQASMQMAVDEGLLPTIQLTDNQRLIAERQGLEIVAQRALEKAAIALSLYLRDASGKPLQPSSNRLPGPFPPLPPAEHPAADDAVRVALTQRPELSDLALEKEQIELDVRQARNAKRPNLDLLVGVSQDVGEAVNDPDDKGDLELAAGLRFSLPAQRREAKGSLQATHARMRQVEQEIRLQEDQITLEVLDAISARDRANQRIEAARRSVLLAHELEEAERFQFAEGDSDLLRVNIRERQAALAASFLVDVIRDYFAAWTRYQTVMGSATDPDQLIPRSPES